jgi:hypothetical protein
MTLLLDVLGVLLLLVMLGALFVVSPWLALAAVCGLLAAACLVLAYRRDVPRETEASE